MSKDWQRVAMVGLAFPFKGGMAALKNRLAIELQKAGKDVEIFGFKRFFLAKFMFTVNTIYDS